ncbi:hypothetical protein V8C86DRAFT_3147042, partial [Haematococcus lacustris]
MSSCGVWFSCLYTKQINKKKPSWSDGFARDITGTLTLFSDEGTSIASDRKPPGLNADERYPFAEGYHIKDVEPLHGAPPWSTAQPVHPLLPPTNTTSGSASGALAGHNAGSAVSRRPFRTMPHPREAVLAAPPSSRLQGPATSNGFSAAGSSWCPAAPTRPAAPTYPAASSTRTQQAAPSWGSGRQRSGELIGGAAWGGPPGPRQQPLASAASGGQPGLAQAAVLPGPGPGPGGAHQLWHRQGHPLGRQVAVSGAPPWQQQLDGRKQAFQEQHQLQQQQQQLNGCAAPTAPEAGGGEDLLSWLLGTQTPSQPSRPAAQGCQPSHPQQPLPHAASESDLAWADSNWADSAAGVGGGSLTQPPPALPPPTLLGAPQPPWGPQQARLQPHNSWAVQRLGSCQAHPLEAPCEPAAPQAALWEQQQQQQQQTGQRQQQRQRVPFVQERQQGQQAVGQERPWGSLDEEAWYESQTCGMPLKPAGGEQQQPGSQAVQQQQQQQGGEGPPAPPAQHTPPWAVPAVPFLQAQEQLGLQSQGPAGVQQAAQGQEQQGGVQAQWHAQLKVGQEEQEASSCGWDSQDAATPDKALGGGQAGLGPLGRPGVAAPLHPMSLGHGAAAMHPDLHPPGLPSSLRSAAGTRSPSHPGCHPAPSPPAPPAQPLQSEGGSDDWQADAWDGLPSDILATAWAATPTAPLPGRPPPTLPDPAPPTPNLRPAIPAAAPAALKLAVTQPGGEVPQSLVRTQSLNRTQSLSRTQSVGPQQDIELPCKDLPSRAASIGGSYLSLASAATTYDGAGPRRAGFRAPGPAPPPSDQLAAPAPAVTLPQAGPQGRSGWAPLAASTPSSCSLGRGSGLGGLTGGVRDRSLAAGAAPATPRLTASSATSPLTLLTFPHTLLAAAALSAQQPDPSPSPSSSAHRPAASPSGGPGAQAGVPPSSAQRLVAIPDSFAGGGVAEYRRVMVAAVMEEVSLGLHEAVQPLVAAVAQLAAAQARQGGQQVGGQQAGQGQSQGQKQGSALQGVRALMQGATVQMLGSGVRGSNPGHGVGEALEDLCRHQRIPYFSKATLSVFKPFVKWQKGGGQRGGKRKAQQWKGKGRKGGGESDEGGSGGEAEGAGDEDVTQPAVRFFLILPTARVRFKTFRRHDIWFLSTHPLLQQPPERSNHQPGTAPTVQTTTTASRPAPWASKAASASAATAGCE